eukprot:766117-Hanusia_phi.AAC.1
MPVTRSQSTQPIDGNTSQTEPGTFFQETSPLLQSDGPSTSPQAGQLAPPQNHSGVFAQVTARGNQRDDRPISPSSEVDSLHSEHHSASRSQSPSSSAAAAPLHSGSENTAIMWQ